MPGPSDKVQAIPSPPWGSLTASHGPEASAGSRRPPAGPWRSPLPRSSLLPARPAAPARRAALPALLSGRTEEPTAPGHHAPVAGSLGPVPSPLPSSRCRTPQPATTRPQLPLRRRRGWPARSRRAERRPGRTLTILRAVRASSLPARAETEGGGGNGFLRRQRRQLPAPHGPFRRLPLMRSAAHPPRREPALRGRGSAGWRLRGAGGRPRPAPGPVRVFPGAAGTRSAALGRRTPLRWGAPHRGVAARGREGNAPLLPSVLLRDRGEETPGDDRGSRPAPCPGT